jgi:hypothetical protein
VAATQPTAPLPAFINTGWGLKPGELVHQDPPSRRAPPAAEQIARNWHRFRGPRASGVSAYANPPDAGSTPVTDDFVLRGSDQQRPLLPHLISAHFAP